MNIIDLQEKLLNQLSTINSQLHTYDNSIEPIKSFPAIVIEPLSESYYNHDLAATPHKCRLQIFIIDTTENNQNNIKQTRLSVANILIQIANIWNVSIEGNIEYNAIKIDGKNAIIADFIIIDNWGKLMTDNQNSILLDSIKEIKKDIKNIYVRMDAINKDLHEIDSIKEIKKDIKNIYSKMDDINKDLQIFYSQKFKCIAEFDKKYAKKEDLQLIIKNEIDIYNSEKDINTQRKSDIIKNFIQIITQLAPTLAIIFTFLAIKPW